MGRGSVKLVAFAMALLLSLTKFQTIISSHLCLSETSELAARLPVNVTASGQDHRQPFTLAVTEVAPSFSTQVRGRHHLRLP